MNRITSLLVREILHGLERRSSYKRKTAKVLLLLTFKLKMSHLIRIMTIIKQIFNPPQKLILATKFCTSDLRTAGKTDRYRRPRCVGGRVLGLSHSVRLVDPLTSTELAVLCRGRAEAWCLIVTCL